MTCVFAENEFVYVSVPKCASTTLKRCIYELSTGIKFKSRQSPKLKPHQYFPTRPFELTETEVGDCCKRFSVIRHPVSRVVSAYNNKIVQNGVLQRDHDADELSELRLEQRPSLRSFIQSLDGYRRVSKIIEHHTQSLMHFVGFSPKWYTRIFDISELSEFVATARTHFGEVSNDLGKLLVTKRTEGNQSSVHANSEDARLIEQRFDRELDLFGAYMKPPRIQTA